MEERALTSKQSYNDEIRIDYLANHLYLPVLYSLGFDIRGGPEGGE